MIIFCNATKKLKLKLSNKCSDIKSNISLKCSEVEIASNGTTTTYITYYIIYTYINTVQTSAIVQNSSPLKDYNDGPQACNV